MDGAAQSATIRRVRGIDRAFEILEFLRLAGRPMRPNEIAQRIGAPRSTVYELVAILMRQGALEPLGGDGRIYLGRKLYFLGMAYAEKLDLLQAAEALLAEVAIETRETAQLCMLDGNKYTVALMHEGARPFRISSSIGEPVPLPWTASGRLLVADLDDAAIRDLIPEADFTLPDGSRLDPAEYLAEVRRAAVAGHFSFDSVVDTFTHCFAVPVRDRVAGCIATLCLVAPREDGLRNHAAYLGTLKRAARNLSQRLCLAPDVGGPNPAER